MSQRPPANVTLILDVCCVRFGYCVTSPTERASLQADPPVSVEGFFDAMFAAEARSFGARQVTLPQPADPLRLLVEAAIRDLWDGTGAGRHLDEATLNKLGVRPESW